MRYCLTGATGYVGGHLAALLLEDGHDLAVIARTPSKARALEERGADIYEGDITDKESMREAMTGADGLFHLAAWYEIGGVDASLAHRINVDGTRNVLELMDECGVPKGVYTSTLAVNSDTGGDVVGEDYSFDGRHLSVYDRTKHQAHYEVVEPMVGDGLPLVTVMPGVIYGPDDRSAVGRAIRDFLRGDLSRIPKRTAYTWGHVEDVARAHVLAMDEGTPGEEYIVGGETATLVEAFDVIAKAAGRSPPRATSPAVFRWLSRVARLLQLVVPLPQDYRAETLRVLAGATYLGDNAKATRELGLEHRPLEAGLESVAEYELERL